MNTNKKKTKKRARIARYYIEVDGVRCSLSGFRTFHADGVLSLAIEDDPVHFDPEYYDDEYAEGRRKAHYYARKAIHRTESVLSALKRSMDSDMTDWPVASDFVDRFYGKEFKVVNEKEKIEEQ